jgi:hypothetical protein
MRNGASSELLLAENDRTFNALWVLGVEEGSFSCGREVTEEAFAERPGHIRPRRRDKRATAAT